MRYGGKSYALCPMPYALCPMPARAPHVTEKGYMSKPVDWTVGIPASKLIAVRT
ncbi:hypothetical protein [Microcoleus sp.]|uniref:hypothetical protein n=1 Tax=Microcoleus sp. TaxID=44472 RepID=UPI00403E44E3